MNSVLVSGRRKLNRFSCILVTGFLFSSVMGNAEDRKSDVTLGFEWVELPTAVFWKIINELGSSAAAPGVVHKHVRELVEKGDAEIVEMVVMRQSPGGVGDIQKYNSIPYYINKRVGLPGRVERKKISATLLTRFPQEKFDKRAGIDLRVELKRGESGESVDLSYQSELRRVIEWKAHAKFGGLMAGKRIPLLDSQFMRGTVTVPFGQQILLNLAESVSHNESGIEKCVLLFVRATSEDRGISRRSSGKNVVAIIEWIDVEKEAISKLRKNIETGELKRVRRDIVAELLSKGGARIRNLSYGLSRIGDFEVQSVGTRELYSPMKFEQADREGKRRNEENFADFLEVLSERQSLEDESEMEIGTSLRFVVMNSKNGKDLKLSGYGSMIDSFSGGSDRPSEDKESLRQILRVFAEFENESVQDGSPFLSGIIKPEVWNGEEFLSIDDPEFHSFMFVKLIYDEQN